MEMAKGERKGDGRDQKGEEDGHERVCRWVKWRVKERSVG
jgi:hypothetical protein